MRRFSCAGVRDEQAKWRERQVRRMEDRSWNEWRYEGRVMRISWGRSVRSIVMEWFEGAGGFLECCWVRG